MPLGEYLVKEIQYIPHSLLLLIAIPQSCKKTTSESLNDQNWTKHSLDFIDSSNIFLNSCDLINKCQVALKIASLTTEIFQELKRTQKHCYDFDNGHAKLLILIHVK